VATETPNGLALQPLRAAARAARLISTGFALEGCGKESFELGGGVRQRRSRYESHRPSLFGCRPSTHSPTVMFTTRRSPSVPTSAIQIGFSCPARFTMYV
jgi:hypothetical protein